MSAEIPIVMMSHAHGPNKAPELAKLA